MWRNTMDSRIASDAIRGRRRLLKHGLALMIGVGGWAGRRSDAQSDENGSSPAESKALEAKLPDIRPQTDAPWGASLDDVRAVLTSTAATLWRYFPQRELKPILVWPRGGPIVLFRRGEQGEYLVRLDTGELYWSQYAYQFAHEFCHILCGYDLDPHRNKWFEESLCEAASLFALRAMAEVWKNRPPYRNWKDYAPRLAKYAQDRLDKGKLPEKTTLAAWYRQHSGELARNATDRARNQIVAGALLTLLEKKPESWEAVTWLNTARADAGQTFPQYLAAWASHAPKRHHAFVQSVAGALGVQLA